jgi:hypothetical protein
MPLGLRSRFQKSLANFQTYSIATTTSKLGNETATIIDLDDGCNIEPDLMMFCPTYLGPPSRIERIAFGLGNRYLLFFIIDDSV